MHKHYFLPILFLLSLFASCEGEDGSSLGADSSSVEVCDCEFPEVTAADVSFDNAGTELQSMSVQAAISEMASKEPPDFADRISVQDTEVTTVAGTELVVAAGCGGNPGDFQAIGGGCSSNTLSNMTLIASEITDTVMECRWRKPDGISKTGSARVICLSLLP